MEVVVPQAELDPAIPPGRRADFGKIPVLPEKRDIKTVKVIAQNVKCGKILLQIIFPPVSAMNVAYR
jgi:hypothetical protein